MQESKSETVNITIDGPDMLRGLREALALPTLTEDEARSAVSKWTRLYRQGSSPGGKTTDGARAVLSHALERGFRPLDPPTGLNRAQRRAWNRKNR